MVQVLHGVRVERLTENPYIIGGDVTCAIVGTAFKGTDPKLVVTLDEAISYYGEEAGNSTLIPALKTFFKYGSGRVVCSPIIVANPTTTSVTAKQYTLSSAGAVTVPHNYITTVTVTSVDATPVTYVVDTDYTIDSVRGQIKRVATGTIDVSETLNIAYSIPQFTPTITSINTAINKLKEVEGLLGVRPNLLLCPQYSETEGINPTLSAVETLRAVAKVLYARVLLDTPPASNTAKVIADRNARTGTLATSDPRVIFTHPKVINSITQKSEYLSVHLAGIMAKVDRDFGYWRSPDNQPLIGVSGVDPSQALSMSDQDPLADNQVLNRLGIYSVVSIPGQGLYGWGQYNSSYPDNADIGKYIPIQQIEDTLALRLADAARPFIGQERGESTVGAIAERLLTVVNSEEALLPGGSVQYLPQSSSVTSLVYSIKVFPKLPIEGITLFLTQTVAL